METEMRKKARVIAFHPDGDYYYQKGMAAYQKGDLHRAKRYVGRAIEFKPDEAEYLCQQAAILAELEQHEASIELLKKVINELDDGLTECYFFMANNYAFIGQFDEAMRVVKHYMAIEPQGSFIQEARELYKLLIHEADDEDEETEQYIQDHENGRQALESGQYEEAVHYFTNAITENPSFWAAYNNLAIAYYSKGEIETAFETLQEILNEDPGNVHALCNQATFCYQLNKEPELAELLAVLKRLHPIYPEHRSKLGATFFFLGYYELAYKWLKSAERSMNRWESTFYYWKAISAYKIGRLSEAQNAWKHVGFFEDTPFEPLEYGKIKELFLDKDAPQNPIVHSLITHQLKEGSPAAKIFSLFMLRRFADERAGAVLNDTKNQVKIERSVRLAAEKMVAEGTTANQQDPRLAVMDRLETSWGQGEPLVKFYEIYGWWQIFFEKSQPTEEMDVQAWAAALEYTFKRSYQLKVTQTELVKKYSLTQYRLKKHIEKVRAMMQGDVSE